MPHLDSNKAVYLVGGSVVGWLHQDALSLRARERAVLVVGGILVTIGDGSRCDEDSDVTTSPGTGAT